MAEPHINISLVLGHGVSGLAPVHESAACQDLILTGERITPAQAAEFGLANRVVPPEQLMSEARALADKLLKQPRQALEESKQAGPTLVSAEPGDTDGPSTRPFRS